MEDSSGNLCAGVTFSVTCSRVAADIPSILVVLSVNVTFSRDFGLCFCVVSCNGNIGRAVIQRGVVGTNYER